VIFRHYGAALTLAETLANITPQADPLPGDPLPRRDIPIGTIPETLPPIGKQKPAPTPRDETPPAKTQAAGGPSIALVLAGAGAGFLVGGPVGALIGGGVAAFVKK